MVFLKNCKVRQKFSREGVKQGEKLTKPINTHTVTPPAIYLNYNSKIFEMVKKIIVHNFEMRTVCKGVHNIVRESI